MRRSARLRLKLLAPAVLLLAPTAAVAHEGHTPLPGGFQAEIVELRDAQGHNAQLPGVSFAAGADGTLLTARNTTSTVLQISGEQAGEPLLRLTADETLVNERSPQASGVQGAAIPTEAAGDLLDLLYQRVEPSWVRLATGGSITFMDHRGALAHVPARGEVTTGDVIGEFSVPVTYGGAAYTVHGRVVAVEATGPGVLPLLLGGLALGVVASAGVALYLRRRDARPADAPADETDLVSVP